MRSNLKTRRFIRLCCVTAVTSIIYLGAVGDSRPRRCDTAVPLNTCYLWKTTIFQGQI